MAMEWLVDTVPCGLRSIRFLYTSPTATGAGGDRIIGLSIQVFGADRRVSVPLQKRDWRFHGDDASWSCRLFCLRRPLGRRRRDDLCRLPRPAWAAGRADVLSELLREGNRVSRGPRARDPLPRPSGRLRALQSLRQLRTKHPRLRPRPQSLPAPRTPMSPPPSHLTPFSTAGSSFFFDEPPLLLPTPHSGKMGSI